jgi:hypothetical protein
MKQVLAIVFLIFTANVFAGSCNEWIKYKDDGDFQFLKRGENFWWPNHRLIIRELNGKENAFLLYPNGNFFRAQSGFYLYPNQNVLYAPHNGAMNFSNGVALKRGDNFFYSNGRPARLDGRLFDVEGRPVLNGLVIIRENIIDGGKLTVTVTEVAHTVRLNFWNNQTGVGFSAVSNGAGFDSRVSLPTGSEGERVALRLDVNGKLSCSVAK